MGTPISMRLRIEALAVGWISLQRRFCAIDVFDRQGGGCHGLQVQSFKIQSSLGGMKAWICESGQLIPSGDHNEIHIFASDCFAANAYFQ